MRTKFGNARIDNYGYYRITSGKEGNNTKRLHDLVFEDYWGGKIPEGYVIHHIDGDKLNNDINNLQMMERGEHISLHKKNKPYLRPIKSNTTGYYRVSKHKDPRYKQGFRYRYTYTDEGRTKYIGSVSLRKLEEKVKAAGQPWIIAEEMVS